MVGQVWQLGEVGNEAGDAGARDVREREHAENEEVARENDGDVFFWDEFVDHVETQEGYACDEAKAEEL